ncbi:phosphotransferase, partial [Pseudonocardia abyssalis]
SPSGSGCPPTTCGWSPTAATRSCTSPPPRCWPASPPWPRRRGRTPRRGAHARGGPVVAPAAHAGPHDVDGFAMTSWEFREVRPGRADPFVVGASLGALHRALDGVPGLPWLTPATTQVTDALDVLEESGARPATEIAALRERHRAVLAELRGSAPVALLGDAHPGNLRRDDDGWFWVDLEETCTGPPEWDLAVAGGCDGVLAGYASVTGRVVDPASLGPFAAARDVEAAAWPAVMVLARPDTYAAAAQARIAQVLARVATGPGSAAAGRSSRPGPSRGSCS